MNYNLDDNIIAISTPSGRSFRGIIRLSGNDAVKLIQNIFTSNDGEGLEDNKRFHSCQGHIYIEEEEVRVPVCVYIMKAPNSYTREDVVEVHTFGSPPILEMVLEKFISLKSRNNLNINNSIEKTIVRFAGPGEFTKRAFLNGRISLTEAESVLHIIRSQSDSELLVSVSNLKGKLAGFLNEIQDELTKLSAGIEAAIDFIDQDIEIISFNEIKKQLKNTKVRLDSVVGKEEASKILHDGVKTVFVGWPNAGKSSLFNRLLKISRSIVTPVSGTTRDTLEAVLNLEGINFRLVDTAGIAYGKGGLETLAVERTHDTLEDAQIVLFFIDASLGTANKEQLDFFNSINTKSKILVINKIDLRQDIDRENLPLEIGAFPIVKTSALTGEGVDELKNILVSSIIKRKVDLSASHIVFNMRQKLVLCRASEILEHLLNSLEQEINYELIAMDLRILMDTIGEITGNVLTEDILEIIFSDFCIGK